MTTARPSSPVVESHWSSLKEAGTLKGLLFLAWLQRTFGRRVYSVVLLPVSLYFCLFRHVARRASLDFLKTHYRSCPTQWRRQPGYWDVVLHFYCFGQAVLDKLLAWNISMSEDEFIIEDEKARDQLFEDNSGKLIIGSHLGNLEYCRGFVHRYKSRKINALVYDKNSAHFVEMMERHNPESRMSVYQVDELDISLILKLKAKVEAGEWLFIAGDRVPLSGDQRTVVVDFLGRPASFPIGPYMLAQALQCKVKLMFSYREKNKVKFAVRDFVEKVTLPRNDRMATIQRLAQHYADALAEQALQAPLQWFNFFPYWQDSER